MHTRRGVPPRRAIWPTRPSIPCASCVCRTPTGRSCSGMRRAHLTPRIRRRRNGSIGSAAASTTGGTPGARQHSTARSRSGSFRPTPSCPSGRSGSSRGRRSTRSAARLYARMMEVCAAFIAHADHQLGRVLDHLEVTGELDNTVVVVVSDNGASGEGGPHGTSTNSATTSPTTTDDIDGQPRPPGRSRRFPLERSLPVGMGARGEHAVPTVEAVHVRRWRAQPDGPRGAERRARRAARPVRHAIDVLPTLLELCGVPLPDELDGIAQMSFDGASLRAVFDDAQVAGPRTSQYFECWGSRAIYADGWKAVTEPRQPADRSRTRPARRQP